MTQGHRVEREPATHSFSAPLVLAMVGGVLAACSCGQGGHVAFYVELRPVVAGAVCLAAGALAGSSHRAFAAGLMFAITWGWAEALFSPVLGYRDTLPLAITSGLLFGFVTMLSHIFCQHAWQHPNNGSATA